MAYATVEQLEEALGYTVERAALLLDRASRDIDRVLRCSTYDTEADGAVSALRAATIEQVAYQLAQGNADGIRHGMQPGVPTGASAGGVDLSRGQSVGGSTTALPLIGEQAWGILADAGLTGQGPMAR
ncbi:hypothetical protein [Actinomadura hibisca]|uniref:hypothetical protein n=1 Tax=Actinomadura hibisca TaxID=68565 RepID=UPI0008375D8B|nr:hypothetical protein [Actinomadura hibisca]